MIWVKRSFKNELGDSVFFLLDLLDLPLQRKSSPFFTNQPLFF